MPPVINAFRSEHGPEVGETGFEAIWLVGPTDKTHLEVGSSKRITETTPWRAPTLSDSVTSRLILAVNGEFQWTQVVFVAFGTPESHQLIQGALGTWEVRDRWVLLFAPDRTPTRDSLSIVTAVTSLFGPHAWSFLPPPTFWSDPTTRRPTLSPPRSQRRLTAAVALGPPSPSHGLIVRSLDD